MLANSCTYMPFQIKLNEHWEHLHYTCISYNTGTHALPDIYALALVRKLKPTIDIAFMQLYKSGSRIYHTLRCVIFFILHT